jgi:WD40 repeat protein
LARADKGERRQHFLAHRKSTVGLAFSHDGKSLATVGFDSRVAIWDCKTGRETLSRPFRFLIPQATLAFTKSSQLVITTGPKREVLDARTGKLLFSAGEPDNLK